MLHTLVHKRIPRHVDVCNYSQDFLIQIQSKMTRLATVKLSKPFTVKHCSTKYTMSVNKFNSSKQQLYNRHRKPNQVSDIDLVISVQQCTLQTRFVQLCDNLCTFMMYYEQTTVHMQWLQIAHKCTF